MGTSRCGDGSCEDCATLEALAWRSGLFGGDRVGRTRCALRLESCVFVDELADLTEEMDELRRRRLVPNESWW